MQLETHSKITSEQEQKEYALEVLVQSTNQPFSDLKAHGSCTPDSVTQPVCWGGERKAQKQAWMLLEPEFSGTTEVPI